MQFLRKFQQSRMWSIVHYMIIVAKPDKGKGVVVVDRVRYIESMQNVISDRTKFQEISQPVHKFVIKIEDKINNFLRKLKNSKVLPDDLLL